MDTQFLGATGTVTGSKYLVTVSSRSAAKSPPFCRSISTVRWRPTPPPCSATTGAAMVGGATSIKIFGEYVPVRARVVQLDNLSAHADQGEILTWLGHFQRPPRMTFITHGEPNAADALRLRIQEQLHWPCLVPQYRDRTELP